MKRVLTRQYGLLRKAAAGFAAKRLAGRVNFERPIFLLGAPRSGSSMLSDLVIAHFDVWSCPRESDRAWWSLFPYPDEDWSDEIRLDQFEAHADADRLKLALLELAVYRRGFSATGYWRKACQQRSLYVEKTIANAFHLDVIHRVFPDARYIHLVRDGRENVSSMLEGWRSGRFLPRPLPEAIDTELERWCFPYPPGWQDQLQRPLNEVCAWSWAEHNDSIIAAIERNGREQQTLTLRYSDVLEHPEEAIRRVAEHIGLHVLDQQSVASTLRSDSWSTVSKPEKDKWRKINREEIEAVEHMIQPVMERLDARAIDLAPSHEPEHSMTS